jgi:glutamate synthase domain-containing protein 3
VAARLLRDWDAALERFVKVMPHDYKRALADLEAEGRELVASTSGEGFVTTEPVG